MLRAPRRRASDAHNNNNVTIYVVAVLVLTVCTIGAVTAITVLRPEEDNTSLIATILGFVVPITLSLMGLTQRENHMAMNSKLDELVAFRTQAARLEALIKGAALKVDPKEVEKLVDIVAPAEPKPDPPDKPTS